MRLRPRLPLFCTVDHYYDYYGNNLNQLEILHKSTSHFVSQCSKKKGKWSNTMNGKSIYFYDILEFHVTNKIIELIMDDIGLITNETSIID